MTDQNHPIALLLSAEESIGRRWRNFFLKLFFSVIRFLSFSLSRSFVFWLTLDQYCITDNKKIPLDNNNRGSSARIFSLSTLSKCYITANVLEACASFSWKPSRLATKLYIKVQHSLMTEALSSLMFAFDYHSLFLPISFVDKAKAFASVLTFVFTKISIV